MAEFVGSTALFRDVEAAVIQQVAPHLQARDFTAQETVVRAGNNQPVLGVVFAGRAVVRQINASTGRATVIQTLRMGDCFGEVGAMLGTAQPHEILAEETSTILFMPAAVLTQLTTRVAPFSSALAKRLAARVVRAGVTNLRAPAAQQEGLLDIAEPADTPAAQRSSSGSESPSDVIRFVTVGAYDISKRLIEMVPPSVIHKHRLMPLELVGNRLTVGMVDPMNIAALEDLRRVLSSVDSEVVAISQDDFNEAFVRLKLDSAAPGRSAATQRVRPDDLVFEITEQDTDRGVRVIGDEVIALTSRIIAAGMELEASDIHIETDATGLRVRFRVGSSLIDWDQYIAVSFAKGLVARIKVLAGLDITERRLPQDGRIGLKVGRSEVDLRVSTLPASRGEKIVIRIFEAASMMRPLERIFSEKRTLEATRVAINRPFGAIVVAGPTGSGKSSTLYSALNERKRTRPDSNIIMVEDPIEYRLPGVTQVQVNHSIELDFARVLRAMLRQDPDVIMVGEVRDRETAQLALEAAMTGHLLFTSLHANNAVGVIQRLENLGTNRMIMSQSLALIMVQRLARKLCSHCRVDAVPAPALLDSLARRGLIEKAAPVPLPRANGCSECDQTGFAGRIAVVESLVISDEVRNELMADRPLGEIEKDAIKRGDLIPFRRYAAFLMTRGLIGPSEALLTVI